MQVPQGIKLGIERALGGPAVAARQELVPLLKPLRRSVDEMRLATALTHTGFMNGSTGALRPTLEVPRMIAEAIPREATRDTINAAHGALAKGLGDATKRDVAARLHAGVQNIHAQADQIDRIGFDIADESMNSIVRHSNQVIDDIDQILPALDARIARTRQVREAGAVAGGALGIAAIGGVAVAATDKP